MEETIEDQSVPLREVQLDGMVLMKIINHVGEFMKNAVDVNGQLLGLDVAGTLEVTNCFPFPVLEEDDDDTGVEYQVEMLRRLREVNVDNNNVGWYHYSHLPGSFLDEGTIANHFTFQEEVKQSVLVVYDPLAASQGSLSFRAYRLRDRFMDVYRKQSFTTETLKRLGVSAEDVFEELPVRVYNSSLASAYLYELQETGSFECDSDRLDLSVQPFLEKSLEHLIERLDVLAGEQSRYHYFQKNLQRQQAQQATYIQKKKQEQAARRLAGEDAEPDEDLSQNPLFQSTTEPSRLNSMLISNQVSAYCRQVNRFTGLGLSKLFSFSHIRGGKEEEEGAEHE